MNRIEYMTKLASLLQDIPEVERKDAMKYYNDYFDEAGEDNEEQVIREFGAPEEVAENIKADLKGKTENTTHAQQEEYQSAGQQYQMNHQENKQSSEYQYGTSDNQKKKNARIGAKRRRFWMQWSRRNSLSLLRPIIALPLPHR